MARNIAGSLEYAEELQNILANYAGERDRSEVENVMWKGAWKGSVVYEYKLLVFLFVEWGRLSLHYWTRFMLFIREPV